MDEGAPRRQGRDRDLVAGARPQRGAAGPTGELSSARCASCLPGRPRPSPQRGSAAASAGCSRASFVNNLGDGVTVAAGPLLVASLTRDPFLVSLAVLSEYLPFLLFGIPGGAVADRVDRKRMVVIANVSRAAMLARPRLHDRHRLGEHRDRPDRALRARRPRRSFADSASSTLAARASCSARTSGSANARIQGAMLLTNQLVGPPIGAFLFTIGMALPFATNAACFLARRGPDLAHRGDDAGPSGADPRRGSSPTWPRASAGSSITRRCGRWRSRSCCSTSRSAPRGRVLVLYASRAPRHGRGRVRAADDRRRRRRGLRDAVLRPRSSGGSPSRDIMRVGLLIETITHLVLALTTSAAVALGMLVVFGGHAFVWGTTSTVVRQRAVPNELMGRVGGVYRVCDHGRHRHRDAARRPARPPVRRSRRRSGSGSSGRRCS